jgi:hypothetical protein
MANTTPTPYSCTIFNKDKSIRPIKIEFCKSIFYLHNWCKNVGFDYHYINIYNRKTGNYISRQYCNDYIIDKPLY